MKKFILCFMLLSAVFLFMHFNGNSESSKYDDTRIKEVITLAKQVEEFKEKTGHYPLVTGIQKEMLVSVIAEKHDFTQAVIHYKKLETEMRTVLGNNFTLPMDPDGRPYQYATDGQLYYVSTFLYKPYFFADDQGAHYNKLEISNLPVTKYKKFRIKDIERFIAIGKDDEELQKQFFIALEKRDFSNAKELINQGANPSPLCGFNHRCQPLARAAEEEDLETMEFLIENGADLDGYNAYYDVALIYALNVKKYKAVELLVKAGANVNLPNHFGISPFIELSYSDDTELLQLMIDNNADLNAHFLGRSKRTPNFRPLEAAVHGGHEETVALLLKAGANPLLKDNNGRTILAFAKEKGKQDIINIISQAIKQQE